MYQTGVRIRLHCQLRVYYQRGLSALPVALSLLYQSNPAHPYARRSNIILYTVKLDFVLRNTNLKALRPGSHFDLESDLCNQISYREQHIRYQPQQHRCLENGEGLDIQPVEKAQAIAVNRPYARTIQTEDNSPMGEIAEQYHFENESISCGSYSSKVTLLCTMPTTGE